LSRSHSSRVRALSVLAAATLIITACGSDSAEETPATDADEESAEDEAADDEAADDEAAEAGGTLADVEAEVADLDRDERRARLIELAGEEDGQITVYTSLSSENMDELAAKFEEDTGIAVLTYRASAEDVRTRALQEHAAGRSQADVIMIGDTRLIPLRDEGILAEYRSPYQEDLIEGSVNDYWTNMRFNLFAVGWNTDQVSPDEAPTSWEDLADPVWDGRMTLESSDYEWYWEVSQYLREDLGYSDEDVVQYWADVTDDADFNQGHTSTRQLLIAGAYALYTSDFSYGLAGAKADGAPVDWEPAVEPLFATPEGTSLVAETTNPASALLAMDYFISDGLAVLDEQGIDVTREDLLDIAGLDIRFVDAEEWFEVEEQAIAEYDALTGAG
jgi:iron(III) transport system substrate-binding protein